MQNQKCSWGSIKKIEEELILGRELATQLLLSHVVAPKTSSSSSKVLNSTTCSDHVSTDDDDDDDDLVMKIFDSFSNCIGLLSTPDQCHQSVKFDNNYNHNQKSADYNIMGVDHHLVDPKSPKSDVDDEPNSEEEGVVKYSGATTSPIIDQNQITSGVHNKRRKLNTSVWERNSPVLVDDGYAWRKYGQKMIRYAKYSRDYFRCSNKYDQGCKAIKQVQKISDNPQVYKTIYHGHHTCIKDLISTILPSDFGTTCHNYKDDRDDYSSGFVISFGKTNHRNKLHKEEDYPFLSSFKSTKNDQPKAVVLLDDHQKKKIDQQQVQQSIFTSDGDDFIIKAASEPSMMHVLSPSLKSSPSDVDFGAFFEYDFDFTDVLRPFEI